MQDARSNSFSCVEELKLYISFTTSMRYQISALIIIEMVKLVSACVTPPLLLQI